MYENTGQVVYEDGKSRAAVGLVIAVARGRVAVLALLPFLFLLRRRAQLVVGQVRNSPVFLLRAHVAPAVPPNVTTGACASKTRKRENGDQRSSSSAAERAREMDTFRGICRTNLRRIGQQLNGAADTCSRSCYDTQTVSR